ncbi:pentapeptide repeat-containing protein [Salinibaculum salinum]|uniref:pentapeptide repeat-containing protein n=1 Tax=Salinibaculum salinum TaxID=3131996 RepID=UPI0030EF72DC
MTNGGTCEYILDPDVPDTWGGSDDSRCFVSSSDLNDEGVWTCPHDAEKGEDLCLFHLPVEQKEDNRVTSALLKAVNSIDDDIEESRLRTQFIGARFGELKIEGESFELPSDQPIDLTHCRFQDHISLTDSKFSAEIDFTGATFEGGLEIVDTTFGRSVNFNCSSFDGKTLFDGVRFDDRVYFKMITASAPLELTSTTLNGWFSFRDAVFEGEVKVKDSSFNAQDISGTFADATFEHKATFERTSITGDFGFTTATFQSGLNFVEMLTKSDLAFHNTVIAGDLVCDETVFDGTLEFKSTLESPKTQVEGEASFEGAKFGVKPKFAEIEFGEASFHNVTFEAGAIFEEVQFDGKIDFSGVMSKTKGNFEFNDVIVNKPANFKESRFRKGIDLSDTKFQAETTFRKSWFYNYNSLDKFDATNVEFGGKVSFAKARFDSPARFTDIEVSGTADFRNVSFHSGSDFSGASFDENILFADAVFESGTDWSEVVIDGDADFSGVDWATTNQHLEPVKHSMTGMKIQGNANFSSLGWENDAVDFSEANVSGELILDE